MILTNPLHIPVWGVCIRTPQVTQSRADLQVITEVSNLTAAPREVGLLTKIMDGKAREHMEKMAGYFHQYDPTRPTNTACHMPGAVKLGVLEPLDTMGWNYGRKYLQARAQGMQEGRAKVQAAGF